MPIELSQGVGVERLKKFQNEIGFFLPSEYVDFLVNFNGMFIGDGTYCDIPFTKVDNGKISFQELYSVDAQSAGMDLIEQNEIQDEVEAFKSPFIIGADPGGNFFLVNCDGHDTSIYYWDRSHIHYDNNYDFAEMDEEGNIYKAFSSFIEFHNAIMNNVGGDVSTKNEKF